MVNLSDLTSPILGAWTISPSFTTGSNIYHPSTNVTFSTTVVHNVTGIASCAIQVASTLYAGVFTPSTPTDGTCSYTFANV